MTKQKMKYSSKSFIKGSEEKKVAVDEGILRQNLGYDDSLFVARVSFERGSIGYVHQHPHSQVAYVESGVFLTSRWVQKPGAWRRVTAAIYHLIQIMERYVWKRGCYWIFSARYVRIF